MNVGDTVIVAQCGVEVEATVLATLPYSAFPAMAGQEGTMYHVQPSSPSAVGAVLCLSPKVLI
jgi:hypothetical protein